MICHFILYVSDQIKSTDFYTKALQQQPILNVSGMTEFKLSENCILGLMPSNEIKKLLGDSIKHPEDAAGVPRAELYLRITDPDSSFGSAIRAGGKSLSSVQERNWGARAGYFADLDGHVVAFSN